MSGHPAESPNPIDPARGLADWIPSLVETYRRGVADSLPNPRAGIAVTPNLSAKGIALIGDSLLKLQRGLTNDRRLSGRNDGFGYMDSPDLLGAYLLYYWPVSYLETFLSLRFGHFHARRILDLGSGPGPAAAAFANAAGTEKALLADGSPAALELARHLLSGQVETRTALLDFEDAALAAGETFDAIVASHLLNELWKDEADRIERRLAFIEGQARRLDQGGFLLVIEPATQVASRELLALRDALAARGWRILAPCPSSRPCPVLRAGPGRSCHGEASWSAPEPVASLAARAGLDRVSVKWTFFVAAPPAPTGSAQVLPSASGASPRGGADSSVSRGRVVSEGLLNKAGRLRYALCSETGLLSLSAKPESPMAVNSGFASLRRYDLVTISGAELREGGLGLSEGSSVTIEPAPLISVSTKWHAEAKIGDGRPGAPKSKRNIL